MKDTTVRKLEMSIRVAGFLTANPIVFRKGSRGPELVVEFKRAVEEVQELSGKQMSAVAHTRAQSSERALAREALLEAMGRISRCAHGMSLANPAMENRFRMPWSRGDSKILASARSFAETVVTFKKEFIAFEMAPDFIDELDAKIAAFEESFANHNASKTALVGSTQQIDNAMDRVMAVLEQLNPIVENKLEGDAVGIQNWRNVRHIERAWVSKKTEETKPENIPPAAAA